MEHQQPSHDQHLFSAAGREASERRTRLVIALTAVMMVFEILSGHLFGSMALLADGWHMASHAAALSITALGYWLARRHASNPLFSFGTGKIADLAGFSSALCLAFIALLMAYESIKRFFDPVGISFNEAIAVAVLGLLVNLVSALLLREQHEGRRHGEPHADHNLSAAYLHVIADALTSLLAIVALTAGRFLGWIWMDPLMGIVGAAVICRWSYGLLKDTSRILLDMNRDSALSDEICQTIDAGAEGKISYLHVWRTSPRRYAAIISIDTNSPYPPEHYKNGLEHIKGLDHVTVEINPLPEG
ncbi:MAG: CDF family Co(II)/Ni(II) efflux transporter DmeF [Pseudomonadota bacterium]